MQPILKNPKVKVEFGNRLIDEIIRRTQDDNVDQFGKPFEGYSTSYVKSSVFDIYGKKKGDVNLTLTFEMLSGMSVKNSSGASIDIHFPSQAQNDKAHGHIHGIPKKRGKSVGLVVRDFFGVPEDKQGEILTAVIKDFNTDNLGDNVRALAAEAVGLLGTESEPHVGE